MLTKGTSMYNYLCNHKRAGVRKSPKYDYEIHMNNPYGKKKIIRRNLAAFPNTIPTGIPDEFWPGLLKNFTVI